MTFIEPVPSEHKPHSDDPVLLNGDPVFDYLKTCIKEGFFLIGAKIIERKTFGPKEPRKPIDIHTKHFKTDQVVVDTFGPKEPRKPIDIHTKHFKTDQVVVDTFGYNRVLREMKKEGLL